MDTASATVGQTITEKQVTELPLNGRNFLQLLFLGAGAVETGGEQGAMRQGVGNAISIMGARPTSNNYMIDGTSNIDTALGTPAAVLSVDAIQEFKEQTTTYSAEYGFSSNQINIVSKTGTNEFHGTGFDFIRNERLDARNFFDSGECRQAQTRSEAVRVRRWRSSPVAVLQRAQQDVLPVQLRRDADRARIQLVLHRAHARQAGGAVHDARSSTRRPGSRSRTTRFRQSRFSRLAQLALRNGWYPAPNSERRAGKLPGCPDTAPECQDQFTIRVDQDLGQATVGCSAAITKTSVRQPRAPATCWTSATASSSRTRRTGRCPTPGRFRSNIVNQFRVGRVEARADQKGIACPQADVDFLRLTGTFTDLPDAQRECPSIGIQGYAGTGGAVNAYTASNQPMWDIGNTTTWIAGNHNLNFGFNYRRW